MSLSWRKRWVALLCAISALIGWSILGSKYALEAANYVVTSPKLTESIRIVQLSDLHNSEFGKNNTRLIHMVKKQRPDIILLTGDMLNDIEPETEVLVRLIEKLAEHEDFDLKFCIVDKNTKSKFLSVRTFDIEVIDIGYSDKVIVLGEVES